jgi:hypothetical protein
VNTLKLKSGGKSVPSNRVISSVEGKFGTVCENFLPVLERLFMKICYLNKFLRYCMLMLFVTKLILENSKKY